MRPLGTGMVVGVVGLALAASGTAAQTRFAWPDTTVDVSRYATVEECLVATSRVAAGYERRAQQAVWRDTLPWDPGELRTPLPAPVVETARRCAARFAVASVPPEEFEPMLRLFLYAGRDADASALVDRRLAATSPTDAVGRARVIDAALKAYLHVPPVRLVEALALVARLDRLTQADVAEWILGSGMELIEAARLVGDTGLVRVVATSVQALRDSMPPAERRKLHAKFGPILEYVVYRAMETQIGAQPFLDSLRRSTAAFVAQKRALWADATGGRVGPLPFPVGERAPALQGDFWFGRDEREEPRPRRGRISLIVFDARGPGQCAGGSYSHDCAAPVAVLRRLAARFPALEITTVTSTRGYFRYVPPPTPAEEAALIQQQFATYGMPGALSVSTSPFWRLPDPDRRRITQPVANFTNYAFGEARWSYQRMGAFLVDEEGILVHVEALDRKSEQRFAELIEVLLNRRLAGR